MATKNIVEIQFGAKGDKDVISAINKLDASTKKLIKTQASLAKESKKQVTNTNKIKEANRKLYTDIKNHGIKSFKELKLETGVLTRAFQGNKVAIRKVRAEMQKLAMANGVVKKGLLDTEHGTRILGGSFAVLRSKMLLASFAGSIFGATVLKLTNLFGEQEKAEKKLETAIGKHSQALLAFASAQQQATTFGDEEIINAMSLVGAYTDNEKAIARITTASMDLAKAKGMDLNSAVDLVSKSIFSSTNALGRYGVAVEGTTGSVDRLESATNSLTNLYGGQAQAEVETFLGSMQQMKNAVGDVGENFGEVLAPAVLLTARGIKAFAETMNSEKIKAYGTAVVGVSVAYIAFTNGAVIATKAVKLLTKASKKNLAIFLGMVAVGKLIDEFNIFGDSTGELTDELKKLEGELGNLNSTGSQTAISFDKLKLAEIGLASATEQSSSSMRRSAIVTEKLKQVRAALGDGEGLTEAQFREALEGNDAAYEQYLTLYAEHLDLEKAMQDERVQAYMNSASSIISSFNNITSQWKTQIEARESAELKSLKSSDKYRYASAEARKKMEVGVTKKFAEDKMNLWKMEKTSSIASIIMNTATAYMKAVAMLPATGGMPLSGIIAGLGAVQLAMAASTKPPTFEKGGLVGGNRHAQGGTMIEAEQGEFVMSRNAVSAIGEETLNQMNQGGGTTTVNVSVNAPLVDDTVIDTLIPAINKAVASGQATMVATASKRQGIGAYHSTRGEI